MDTLWRLTRHVETAIRAQWPEGPKALVAAVSGGADSVCLLHLLHRLRKNMCFSLSVLHVHHGIRGEAAALDAAFVEAQSLDLGLPCETVLVDAPALAAREGLTLEDAARRLRHKAFQDALDSTGAAAVVLAHHCDDQAETVLLHVLRGAASDGLCGMQPFRDGLFRPLLEIPGKMLRLCLAENGWAHREDSSNQDVSFRRNALRHRWIPQVCALTGQDPTGPLVRFAALQREDQALMWQLAKEAAVACALVIQKGPPRSARWDCTAFAALPAALARRVVLLAWEGMAGDRVGFETVHVEAVRHLCQSARAGKHLDLPACHEALRLDGTCVLREKQRAADGAFALTGGAPPAEVDIRPAWRKSGSWSHPVPLPVHVGQEIRVAVPEAEGVLVVRRLSPSDGFARYPGRRAEQTANEQLIDSSALPAGIHIRNRRMGDQFRPWQAPGNRKLKDWFIDRKIPATKRDQIPLLAAENMILWVLGHRAAACMAVNETLKDAYLFTWEGKTKGETCE